MVERLKSYIFAAAIMCGFHSSAQTPPPNDDYENRNQLTGTSITFTGTTEGATLQENELEPFYFQGAPWPPTVWWTWTAPASGEVFVDVVDYSDSLFRSESSYVAVWKNVDWPNRTAGNNWDSNFGVRLDLPGHSHFSFQAEAGTNYDIQVAAVPRGTFTLRLIQTKSPIIYVPPQHRLVSAGGSTFLGVVASGPEPLAYQWRYNGTDIPQQTYPILSIDNFDQSMAGSYTVVVSNSFDSIESAAGIVTVRANDVFPILKALTSNTGNSVFFQISGEPLTSYRIESSTNLIDWAPEQSFPFPYPYYVWSGQYNTSVIHNSNAVATFSVPFTADSRFFRAVRYRAGFGTNNVTPEESAASEVCINNLRKIRFAKQLAVIEREGFGWDGEDPQYTFYRDEITPYLAPCSCPSFTDLSASDPGAFVISYLVNQHQDQPSCMVDSTHTLEEPPDFP